MKQAFFNGKRILVTGCCGTVGSELVDQLLNDYQVKELIGIDNNESELFFTDQKHSDKANAQFFIADIRDCEKLKHLMSGVDIVFHSAAYKHVILCEKSPFEAVQTNILGVKNIIQAAHDAQVSHVVFTSSDKAVNPTNVMGTSKLMGERLITAANSDYHDCKTRFISTRFGNVLGSRGSVIPIFKDQIKKGGPITLTDKQMTRFIMSIDEAVRLVIDSAVFAQGGEVFVTKMPVIKISDLAEVMIQELAPKYGHKPEDIEVKIIGAKAGEKLYEELMTDEETPRTTELEQYFAVRPAYKPMNRQIEYEYEGVISDNVQNAYNSANEKTLTQEELKAFLYEHKLLNSELDD